MPTIGYRPTLETTQAVGALLLHQFARDQFERAGVDENLIRDAEHLEGVDNLIYSTLLGQPGESADPNHSNIDSSCHDSNICSGDHECTHTSLSMSNIDDPSHVTGSSTPRNMTVRSQNNSCMTMNTTLVSDQLEQTYHSMREQSLNGTAVANAQDRTIYHSVNNSTRNNDTTNHTNISDNTLERFQSLPDISVYGNELRRIAQEFERSSLREIVRQRANQVNLSDISKESFTRLLKELFQESITREKVVILFFFCTDVALRAAEFAKELVVKLMGWSFSYIINIVCSFVHRLGGWDKVLFYQLPSLLITCCAGLAICALMVFLRNSLRSPTHE